ncbi:MAG TPA: DUF4388 domain-containing protein [Ktedonobacteraceae bacterium]
MPHQRETATDRLSNVIQVIQLGKKSGLLTVERGEGITFEEGAITFVNGQAREAQVGKYTGIDAFNWLNTWGPCLFAFTPTASAETTAPTRSPTTGKLSNTTGGLTALKPAPRDQWKSSQNGNIGGGVNQWKEHSPVRLEPWGTIPNRTRQIEETLHMIDRIGLSRAHRHLFLLIDGYRGIQELVRLMGREQDEVQRLLNDLELAGLIQR